MLSSHSNSTRILWFAATSVLVLLVLRTKAAAQDGAWNNNNDGQWEDAANWVGNIIADGADNTADFNSVDVINLGTPFYRAGVGLTTSRTIGHMVFGDTNTASPGAWELYQFSGTPTITFAGTSPSITVNPLTPFQTVPPDALATNDRRRHYQDWHF
jgi:hypothetical protein